MAELEWTKKNLAIKIAGPHVIECLEKHGWELTLHHMVIYSSKGDDMLQEFLTMLPSIYALRDFLKRMPSYEVDEETFEYYMKSGYFI